MAATEKGSRLELGGISVDVVRKEIENVHLSVHPPTGRVRLAAPRRASLETLRLFAVSKLAWIKRQRRRFAEQARETRREYLAWESHFVWGERYLLEVLEVEAPPSIELGHRRLYLRIRPGTDREKRRAIVEVWSRERLREAVQSLLERWEPILGVRTEGFFVQRMKTRWGSSNPERRTIRLNTELLKKPRECLEYIVVHELLHFLEPTHGERFIALLDHHLPRWRHHREVLNRLPVGEEEWTD